MSFVEKSVYQMVCDRCGSQMDRECYHEDKESLVEIMAENGFVEKDGKHYCQDCYFVGDDDSIIVKDNVNSKY